MYSFKRHPEAVSQFHWQQRVVGVMGRHPGEGKVGMTSVKNAGENLQRDLLVVRITKVRARRDRS